MKNKLHLNGAFGLVLIGIGAFATMIMSLAFWEDYRRYVNHSAELYRNSFPFEWEMIAIFILGIGHLITGSGLMGRAKWARLIGNLTCWSSILLWTYFVFAEFDLLKMARRDEFWLLLGLTLGVYILHFCGLLLLGNEKMIQDVGEIDKGEWEEEILDL